MRGLILVRKITPQFEVRLHDAYGPEQEGHEAIRPKPVRNVPGKVRMNLYARAQGTPVLVEERLEEAGTQITPFTPRFPTT
jgi:hypothetical protein